MVQKEIILTKKDHGSRFECYRYGRVDNKFYMHRRMSLMDASLQPVMRNE